MGHTIEKIRNPDIYMDVLGEVVCDNLRIWRRKTEYVREKNDCFGPLCCISRCRGKVVRTDHGALWLTRDDETSVAT